MTLFESKCWLSKSRINIQLIIADAEQASVIVLFIFLAITSIENNKPANGLQNKTATPAVTPAHINSLLYFLAENSFS